MEGASGSTHRLTGATKRCCKSDSQHSVVHRIVRSPNLISPSRTPSAVLPAGSSSQLSGRPGARQHSLEGGQPWASPEVQVVAIEPLRLAGQRHGQAPRGAARQVNVRNSAAVSQRVPHLQRPAKPVPSHRRLPRRLAQQRAPPKGHAAPEAPARRTPQRQPYPDQGSRAVQSRRAGRTTAHE